PVRMVDVAARDVVAERRLPGRVKADRDAELLDRVPEWLELEVVDVAPADRVRVADDSDRPELAHGASRLLDGEPDVVERDLGGEIQAGGGACGRVARAGRVRGGWRCGRLR